MVKGSTISVYTEYSGKVRSEWKGSFLAATLFSKRGWWSLTKGNSTYIDTLK